MGNQGITAAKFDVNIRCLRGTVMGLPQFNPSTESDFYVGLPAAFNAVPVGVLGQDVVEPGYPLTSELWLDPTAGTPINGSTPPAPFISGASSAAGANLGLPAGRAWEVVTDADEYELIAADLTITADCDLVIADAYGRVTNISNVPGGTTANVVGRAKYPATAVNQRIRASVKKRQVKV
jgi:hypothetical protein